MEKNKEKNLPKTIRKKIAFKVAYIGLNYGVKIKRDLRNMNILFILPLKAIYLQQ
jgi:hypothetical protein